MKAIAQHLIALGAAGLLLASAASLPALAGGSGGHSHGHSHSNSHGHNHGHAHARSDHNRAHHSARAGLHRHAEHFVHAAVGGAGSATGRKIVNGAPSGRAASPAARSAAPAASPLEAHDCAAYAQALKDHASDAGYAGKLRGEAPECFGGGR